MRVEEEGRGKEGEGVEGIKRVRGVPHSRTHSPQHSNKAESSDRIGQHRTEQRLSVSRSSE